MAPSASEPSCDSEPVDLATTPQSLARAVLARRREYVRPQTLRVKIGTWNVAACPGTDKDLAAWLVDSRAVDRDPAIISLDDSAAPGAQDVGLYVLGLQEVVDLNGTREYMNRAVYTDNGPSLKWQAAVEALLPSGYVPVVAEQMTGILLLVYASPEVAPIISNVSTKQVGTGLLGYFGNKGAVTTRLVLGETTRMVFVNCHLASGVSANALDRRRWDVAQILAKTQFDPVVHAGVVEDDGDCIGDEDFAFWFGDLNFRLEGLPAHDIRRLLTLHTRGEYGASRNCPPAPLDGHGFIVMKSCDSDDDTSTTASLHSRDQSFDSKSSLPDPDDLPDDPSQDPTSLQSTLDSLLPHDQLRRIMASRKLLNDGWREGHIDFLPTYKYDVGTIGLFDSSEKQRAPSWCDRILYRTRNDKQAYERRIEEERAAKKKDEEMRSRGLEEDDDVLFSYDPDTDGESQPRGSPGVDYDEYDEAIDDGKPEEALTRDGFVDRIHQDIYTSHQRITSSDHKPVVSVFTLEYDAVVPELKAHVHAEVARELDRAENEGRPGITIVVEGDKGHLEGAVDFGPVAFLERASAIVTVANTGGVPASFAFVEKPTTDDDEAVAASWLTTSFVQADDDATDPLGKTVTLEPGETVLAHIEAEVSAVGQLRALNDGHAKLEDILVLRVEDGRDHFIPVRGTWIPTCFGRSMDELIRVPDGGIRQFARDKGITGAIGYDLDVHCSAPKELFKLTEVMQTLAERCVADEAMLDDLELPRDPGWPLDASTWATGVTEQKSVKAAIVAALDTDTPIVEALPVELSSAQRLEVVSSVLLLFLASLTDGLVPPHVWAKLLTTLPNLTALPCAAWPGVRSQVLDVLATAPNHNIAFVFLTATVSRVASELSPGTTEGGGPLGLSRRLSFRRGNEDGSKKRRTRERKYAEILGPLVFRAKDKDKALKDKERTMIEMFLSREASD